VRGDDLREGAQGRDCAKTRSLRSERKGIRKKMSSQLDKSRMDVLRRQGSLVGKVERKRHRERKKDFRTARSIMVRASSGEIDAISTKENGPPSFPFISDRVALAGEKGLPICC